MPSLVSRPTTSFFNLPFRKNKCVYELNPPDETYSVTYLGNVLTSMGKGEASIQKPLNVIWKTYNSKRTKREISMKLCVTRSGLKADTKQGTTEYWANRVTYCSAPAEYPRIFCWVYKHEGKRMKPDLRCHAVLCRKTADPVHISSCLNNCLQAALLEYKREKLMIEKSRKSSLCGGIGPRRKIMLQTGSLNFRTPMCRSKSAPRLGSIDEEDEDDKRATGNNYDNLHEEEDEDDDEEGSDIDNMSYHNTPNFTDSSSDCSTMRRTKRDGATAEVDASSVSGSSSIDSAVGTSSSPPSATAARMAAAVGDRHLSRDASDDFDAPLATMDRGFVPLTVRGRLMPSYTSDFTSSCPAVSFLETSRCLCTSDSTTKTRPNGSTAIVDEAVLIDAAKLSALRSPDDRRLTDLLGLAKLRLNRQNSLDDSRAYSSNSTTPDHHDGAKLDP